MRGNTKAAEIFLHFLFATLDPKHAQEVVDSIFKIQDLFFFCLMNQNLIFNSKILAIFWGVAYS